MIRKAVGGIVFWSDQLLLVEKVQISDTTSGTEAIATEWDIPKGGVKETDVDHEHALLRELKEETGSSHYSIQFAYPEQITFNFPPDIQEKIGFTSQTTILFRVHYTGDGSDLKPLDSEIRQAIFVPINVALEKITHSETREFIKRVI